MIHDVGPCHAILWPCCNRIELCTYTYRWERCIHMWYVRLDIDANGTWTCIYIYICRIYANIYCLINYICSYCIVSIRRTHLWIPTHINTPSWKMLPPGTKWGVQLDSMFSACNSFCKMEMSLGNTPCAGRKCLSTMVIGGNQFRPWWYAISPSHQPWYGIGDPAGDVRTT